MPRPRKPMKITLNDITRAERGGACLDALRWLEAKERTVEDLVENEDGWGYWVLMRTARARKAVRDRVAELLRVRILYWDDGSPRRIEYPATVAIAIEYRTDYTRGGFERYYSRREGTKKWTRR